MSEQYTTGEIAKLCGISVRTVQYYDTRGILIPSAFSEGGRRLYSEPDLEKMKIICFLREAGFSINSIGSLFAEADPGSVISILVEQQEKELREEILEQQKKLAILGQIRHSLKNMEHFSVDSIGDIAHIMKNKKKLHRIHMTMLAAGIPGEIFEISALIYALQTGNWWLFALSTVTEIGLAVWISAYYYQNVAYICPQCHKIFRAGFREMFFAAHTPAARKLTCTCCGHKGFCVETCREEKC